MLLLFGFRHFCAEIIAGYSSGWLDAIPTNHIVAVRGVGALHVVLLILRVILVTKLLAALIAVAPRVAVALVVSMIARRLHHDLLAVSANGAPMAEEIVARALARDVPVRPRLKLRLANLATKLRTSRLNCLSICIDTALEAALVEDKLVFKFAFECIGKLFCPLLFLFCLTLYHLYR